ncbi:OTU domain-containing protein 5-like [Anneissia japonica]|uniref:OTU domain-containing protein 5-like n=1 Tax=Anneissia japonica TaxID=1529436 RepID=UPI0014255F3E|nr:OTU domain-containing protein 5-like [Anneissia japonica]
MTILPKKNTSKEKKDSKQGENHHSHSQHNSSSEHRSSGGARPKCRNSPPRWLSSNSREERHSLNESRLAFRENYESYERTNRPQSAKRARHRSSPHREHVVGGARTSTNSSSSRLEEENEQRDAEASLGYEERNSEDEYDLSSCSEQEFDELEVRFEKLVQQRRGLIIKKMVPDGGCLFRVVADQVYGDQEWHSIVRQHCMDYMMKNADYFSQFVTEDFTTYINRKRLNDCHGNHVEMQAMSEMYNRNIEVFVYSLEPINTFHGINVTGNAPIRVSYHRNIHYNSMVDPYKATIGVGLGLPSFKPGLADRTLMKDAIKMSENTAIEQTMLEDKVAATDWEATSEAIEEQVARESYLQWLKDNEKRATKNTSSTASATCSSAPVDPPHRRDMAEESHHRGGLSPRHRSGTSSDPSCSTSYHDQTKHAGSPPRSPLASTSGSVAMQDTASSSESSLSSLACSRLCAAPSTSEGAQAPENQMQNISPGDFGYLAWDTEDAIVASILAQSQQEYFDSLKRTGPS